MEDSAPAAETYVLSNIQSNRAGMSEVASQTGTPVFRRLYVDLNNGAVLGKLPNATRSSESQDIQQGRSAGVAYLSASLPNILQGAVKPSRQQVLTDPQTGEERAYFQFPGGQIRRQIGEGHSESERKLRRAKRNEKRRGIRENKRTFEQWTAALKKQAKAAQEKWFAGLSPEDQAFAREHGLHKPMPAEGFRRPGSEDALDEVEGAEIPDAPICGRHNRKAMVAGEHPVISALEPQELAVALEQLSPDEVRTAAEDFEHALRWALEAPAAEKEAHPLVNLGRRTAVVIAALHPELGAGLPIEPTLARAFLSSFRDFRFSETLERLQATGAVYGRVVEWLRRAPSIADLGARLQLVAYELRPDLIDQATYAEIANPQNKTRQAVSRVAGDLRDTFASLKALSQRGTETRLRCQSAQLCPA